MTSQPTTQLTPAELLAVAAGGWGYAEAEWIDGWHARASERFTNRANSAWPVDLPDASGGPDLARTLTALRSWYAARDLPALAQCVAGSELDHAIAACGYDRAEQLSQRQNARVDVVLAALARYGADSRPGTDCVLTDRPDAGWLSVYRAGTLPPVAPRVLGDGDDGIRFATITDARDGATLAIGRVALSAVPGTGGPAAWAGIAGIEVVPAARRRGLAKAVIRELIDWAAGRGVADVFLEVFSTNAAALELYRTLGFSVHHAYHYRVLESRLG